MANSALELHLLATGLMTGAIWLVQLLIYPAFARIPAAEFPRHHAEHAQRIGWIVGPGMLIELLTAIGIFLQQGGVFWKLQLGLIALNWILTAWFASSPHARLARQFERSEIERLVRVNWLRTGVWTLRAISLAWLL